MPHGLRGDGVSSETLHTSILALVAHDLASLAHAAHEPLFEPHNQLLVVLIVDFQALAKSRQIAGIVARAARAHVDNRLDPIGQLLLRA